MTPHQQNAPTPSGPKEEWWIYLIAVLLAIAISLKYTALHGETISAPQTWFTSNNSMSSTNTFLQTQNQTQRLVEVPSLRQYQANAISDLEQLRSTGVKRVMVSCPTGAGKTTIASSYILMQMQAGMRTIFIAHRTELIEQAADRLLEFGIRAGYIKSGYKYKARPVQVASIQTLTNRVMPDAEVIIIDEAHHAMSDQYRRVVDHYIGHGAYVIGLSATPYRMDGRGLADLFDELISPASVLDLIKQGYLCKPRYLSPDPAEIDLSDVKLKQSDGYKDYDANGMFQKHFGKKEVYAGLIDNYRKCAEGKRVIIFNCNLEHSLRVVEAFNAAGYPAVHIDGKMDRFKRKRILQDHKAGRFPILSNVQLLTEGYDDPGIEAVIINRKTKSKALWIQMVGRVLRPAKGKEVAWVIDQGANVYEHGRVDVNEVLTLQASGKKGSGAKGACPVKSCPQCATIQFVSAMVCEDCGYEWPKEDKLNKKAVTFVEVDDQMLDKTRKPTANDLPGHLRYKPFDEMTLDELETCRVTLGHKHLWVVHKLRDRCMELERPWDMLQILTKQYAKTLGYADGWVTHAMSMVAKAEMPLITTPLTTIQPSIPV